MLLSNIINGLPQAFSDVEVNDVTHNSRLVKEGTIFVCFAGVNRDGHDYANLAIKNGATVVICERDLNIDRQVIVKNAREIYSLICREIYDNPQKKLKLIGVTGTCGKTSVTYIIKKILEHSGKKVGIIGTIQNMIGEQIFETHNTTPDPKSLFEVLAENVKAGSEYVIMEVSSQALVEQRVFGLHFEIAVFTNISQDHLDFHKTMDNYKAAKRMLFDIADYAIINIDDTYGKQLIKEISIPATTYSIKDASGAFRAHNVLLKNSGVDFELVSLGVIGRVKFAIPGEFSVYNALAAVATCSQLGVAFASVIDALSLIDNIKGRMETVPTDKDFAVIIDFAHTPEELLNACKTLKNINESRLITVFGCGGDRDKTKRHVMGDIAVRYSDFVVITSDNPRTEEAGSITKDIVAGIDKSYKNYTVIVDRTAAIEYAISIAKHGDTVLIAGKGHELYQIIGTSTIDFDERKVIRQALNLL